MKEKETTELEEKTEKKTNDCKSGKKSGSKGGRRHGRGSKPPYKRTNDVSWQTGNSELVKAAANIFVTRPAGIKFDLTTEGKAVNVNVGAHTLHTLPGVMGIQLMPSYGDLSSDANALEIQKNALYVWMRQANSGSRNYEAADLMLYVLAGENLVKVWSYLTRLYALLETYNSVNRFWPRRVLYALGIDDDTIDYFSNHMADLRYFINQFTYKVNSLNIPMYNNISRSMFINSKVYKDADSSKAQLYILDMRYVYEYAPTIYTTGGSLELYTITPTSINDDVRYSGWCKGLMHLVDVILTDEDCAIMGGDILKAFGNNIVKLPEVPEGITITPEADLEVLEEIQNLTINGDLIGPDETQYPNIEDIMSNDYGVSTSLALEIIRQAPASCIVQDTDHKLHQVSLFDPMSGLNVVLKTMTTFSEDPKPEDLLILSNLMNYQNVYYDTPNAKYLATVTNPGTEIALTAIIIDDDYSHPTIINSPDHTNWSSTPFDPGTTIGKLDKFGCHPLFYTNGSGTLGTVSVEGIVGDVDNYAFLAAKDLHRLHDVSWIGLLNLGINKFTK
jgi:hypothetical protein